MLMLIGEAPGQTEDETATPFVGTSGVLLRREFKQASGQDLSDVAYVTNIVSCKPPSNRVPMPDEIDSCRPRLDALVHVVAPKAILVLGGTSLMAVLGKQGITRQRGKWAKSKWRWKGSTTEVDTLPTLHPAGLLPGRLQDGTSMEQFRADLKAVFERAYS